MAHQPPGWHREDIKAALVKRYGLIVRLSETWGYHRSMITGVLRNPCFSIPVERRIAAALDVTPHVLWPDRWNPGGEPLPRRSTKPSTRDRVVSCQKSRAA
jgi:Ner family transcriptional regulator